MQSPIVVASRSGEAARMPSRRALKRLSAFDRRLRPRVVALAGLDARLADLALTFPALLVALAVPRPGIDRARARSLALAGAPLKSVAAAAGVPMWLRPLPPRAFTGPIPALPDSLRARLEMPNYVPRDPRWLERWLEAVALAAEAGNEAIAIWSAREVPRAHRPEQVRRIALWAWFSVEGQGTTAQRYIDRPWTPSMTWQNAMRAAGDFAESAELHFTLASAPVSDPWIGRTRMLGYDFVPLCTPDAIADEAAAMNNCVRSYGWSIASNYCRLFGVRDGATRVATLEIHYGSSDPYPWITQLQGPGNTAVPKSVWLAARRWIVAHAEAREIESREDLALNAGAWRAWWRPYWLAKRRFPSWLPIMPPRDWRGF